MSFFSKTVRDRPISGRFWISLESKAYLFEDYNIISHYILILNFVEIKNVEFL